MAENRRNILVIGATGKQGSATVRSLLQPSSPPSVPEHDWHVWALTRKASSALARALVEKADNNNAGGRLTLVEGNLDDAIRIRKIFETVATSGGKFWGVFVAIAFPGLEDRSDKEAKQGTMLVELALEFDVQAFVYSSSLQPAPDHDDTVHFSRISKRTIERRCKDLGDEGLRWIILQPAQFMENFDGLIGAIATTVFHDALKKDTTINIIASDDIGRVAAAVFADPKQYVHKVLALTAEEITMEELKAAYKEGTGKTMPAIPSVIGKVILWLNPNVQTVVEDIERRHDYVRNGGFPTFGDEQKLALTACHMQTYEEWTRRRREEAIAAPKVSGWNKVSLCNLLLGRS